MSKKIEQIYSEICLGYSKDIWKNSIVYIKHFSNLDLVEIDSFYNELLDGAKSKGIKSHSEKTEWLVSKKLWNKAKDMEIIEQQDFVDSLRKTNEKLIFPSQKKQNEKILEEESIKLNRLINDRENLMGLTAEKIANQKIQFYYVYLSFFKDQKLEDKFFTLENIHNLDDDESFELLNFYIEINENFNVKNIKKIAISNIFTNNFYICGENIQSFFAKPLYLLTNYQSNLLSYGSYFKHLLSTNPELPKNIKDDPEKLEEFIKQGQNFKDMIKKVDANVQSVGIPATKSDFEAMGLVRDTKILDSKGPQSEK